MWDTRAFGKVYSEVWILTHWPLEEEIFIFTADNILIEHYFFYLYGANKYVYINSLVTVWK